MNGKFNKWYKETSERFSFNPPDGVWENIEHDLDINDVWKRVSGELDHIRKRNRMRRENLVVFSALFFLFSLYFVIDNISVRQSVKNIVSQEYAMRAGNREAMMSPETMTGITANAGESITAEAKIPQRNNVAQVTGISRNIDGISNGKSPDTPVPDAASPVSSFRKLNPMKHDLPGAPFEAASVIDDYVVRNPRSDVPDGNKHAPVVYFGMNYMLFNNWLVNNATMQGFTGNETSETVLNFSSATSFSFGINSTEKSGFRIDWVANAKTGQSYHYYSDGDYITSTIQLTYHHLNILHKRKLGMNRSGNDTYGSSNLLTGINLRFLQSAMEKTGNTLKSVSDEYNNDDLGIYIGYEYERILFGNFMVSASVNSQIGFTDIRKRDFSAPGYYNRTRNFSIGALAGLRYSF